MESKNEYDKIQSLTACEAVRLRPNIYFEKCFKEQHLDDLPLEVACHAIDEVFDNNCTSIAFVLFDDYFSLKYDAGMSLEKRHDKYRAELIMTAVFACRNEKKHLEVGAEFCNLGIATINFASEHCTVTTVANGQKGMLHFEAGQLVSLDVKPVGEQAEFTEIVLKPDPSIFKDLKFSFDGVKTKTDNLSEKLDGVHIRITHS